MKEEENTRAATPHSLTDAELAELELWEDAARPYSIQVAPDRDEQGRYIRVYSEGRGGDYPIVRLVLAMKDRIPSLISDLREARKALAELRGAFDAAIHPPGVPGKMRETFIALRKELDEARLSYVKAARERDEARDALKIMHRDCLSAWSPGTAAQPPPDSSAALREARRLLGEAQRWMPGYQDELKQEIRAFLGEPAAGPSSPLDPGEQNGKD